MKGEIHTNIQVQTLTSRRSSSRGRIALRVLRTDVAISSSEEISMISLNVGKRWYGRRAADESGCVIEGDVVRVRMAGIVGMTVFCDVRFIVSLFRKNKRDSKTKNPVAYTYPRGKNSVVGLIIPRYWLKNYASFRGTQ